MRFFRMTVSHTQGSVVAICEQDTPFETGGIVLIEGEDCETFDLGFVATEHSWQRLDGTPCRPAEHFLVRLMNPTPEARESLPEIVDVPCTLHGIKQRMREKGPRALPLKIRAWLAVVLPEDRARELALPGVPIAALKALEQLRNKRDPHSGSRMNVLERIVQQRSDYDARVRHARRLAVTNSPVGS